jgi:Family of unknown function (DUF5670)
MIERFHRIKAVDNQPESAKLIPLLGAGGLFRSDADPSQRVHPNAQAAAERFLISYGLCRFNLLALRAKLNANGNERAIWRPYRKSLTYKEEIMFMALCAILFIAWLLGLTAFHVAGGLIHLLLIFAVISLIIHLVRGRGAV